MLKMHKLSKIFYISYDTRKTFFVDKIFSTKIFFNVTTIYIQIIVYRFVCSRKNVKNTYHYHCYHKKWRQTTGFQ